MRRGGLAVDNGIVQYGGGSLANIQAGDEQAGFEATGLTGSPRLAGFVSAQAHTDDVVGVDAGGGQGIQRTQHTFVIAAEDDPVGDFRVRGDDRAGGILRRQGFTGVGHREDLAFGHARGLDGGFFVVGAVIADREGLDFHRENAHLLGRVVNQPLSVSSLAAASPTFLPMSLPSKPTNGTGLPSASLMLSSVAIRVTPASDGGLWRWPARWSGRER